MPDSQSTSSGNDVLRQPPIPEYIHLLIKGKASALSCTLSEVIAPAITQLKNTPQEVRVREYLSSHKVTPRSIRLSVDVYDDVKELSTHDNVPENRVIYTALVNFFPKQS